jgi:hypothetical protein
MSNTSTDIHDSLKKCKYYEDTIMRNSYFRPWLKNVIVDNNDQSCLDYEVSSALNKSNTSNDPLKQYYSSHGFAKGFPSLRDKFYEPFTDEPNILIKIIVLTFIMYIILLLLNYAKKI